MKGKLNIYRDSFLEREELNRLVSFIEDNPALFLFISSTQSFGIIQQGVSLTLDPCFKVEVGTNANTIKVGVDSYALDIDGNLIYQRAFDNMPIPTDDLWYWVKVSHRYDNYEQGFIDIGGDGTLTGVGTLFTETLRGASSGFPTKVRFYIEESDGSLTVANNGSIYEVVSVEDDTTAIVAGSFVPESNLRCVVLGAFSIKTSIGSITSTGLYSYDSCSVEFVLEESTDTPPSTGFIADSNFYVARIKCNGATTTIQDKRSNYYFRLDFGDIVVNNKADINAANLTAPDILAWLSKLNIYTQSEVDSAVSLLLEKSENLNDLANKATARSNLGVYSTTVIDALGILTTKVIEIGDWDMDSSSFVDVAHGIADWTKVREVSAIIRRDDDALRVNLESTTTAGAGGGQCITNATNIQLLRVTGGAFDNVNFDSTGYNRGWIVIKYTA